MRLHGRKQAIHYILFLLLVSQPLLAASSDRPVSGEKPMPLRPPVTFVGQIPCADCPGIRVTLTLREGGLYLERYEYLERSSSFVELGRWSAQEDGTRLVLDSGKAREQWAMVGSTIRKLDNEGRAISSPMNYTLRRADKVDPFNDAFRLRGEYAPGEGGGTFTECQSGAKFAVKENNSAAIGKAYSDAKVAPGAPLLITVEGSLVHSQEKRGKGGSDTLQVSKFEGSSPNEHCSTP